MEIKFYLCDDCGKLLKDRARKLNDQLLCEDCFEKRLYEIFSDGERWKMDILPDGSGQIKKTLWAVK